MLDKLQQEIELIGRHLEVVHVVVAHQPIGIMKLADLLDLPYHRVRYSLRVLEQGGYIRATPSGAMATPRAEEMLLHLDENIDKLIATLEAMKSEQTQ
jgi:predicted transcriptional regulator